jgi:hypothetical protein
MSAQPECLLFNFQSQSKEGKTANWMKQVTIFKIANDLIAVYDIKKACRSGSKKFNSF